MVEGDKNLDIEWIRDKLSELQSTTPDQRSEGIYRMLRIFIRFQICIKVTSVKSTL